MTVSSLAITTSMKVLLGLSCLIEFGYQFQRKTDKPENKTFVDKFVSFFVADAVSSFASGLHPKIVITGNTKMKRIDNSSSILSGNLHVKDRELSWHRKFYINFCWFLR